MRLIGDSGLSVGVSVNGCLSWCVKAIDQSRVMIFVVFQMMRYWEQHSVCWLYLFLKYWAILQLWTSQIIRRFWVCGTTVTKQLSWEDFLNAIKSWDYLYMTSLLVIKNKRITFGCMAEGILVCQATISLALTKHVDILPKYSVFTAVVIQLHFWLLTLIGFQLSVNSVAEVN